MTLNDILRRLRYALNLSDAQAAALFQKDPLNALELSQADFRARIARPEEPEHKALNEAELAAFLDGLIIARRGPRPDSSAPRAAAPLTRNEILKKLRIALNLKDDEMRDLLAAGGRTLSKGELSALFRAPTHKHFRPCGNQVLRAFLQGLSLQRSAKP